MRLDWRFVRVARFILEARSPLSVAAGAASLRYDTSLVRDANGLPTVPGTSLAGVLRHLYAAEHGESEAEALFGVAHRRDEEGGDMTSRVQVSFGCVLDSRGRPVEGLLLGGGARRLREDRLLALLADEAPVLRRRVRINHRGAADAEQRGLFDRSAVPAGTRFAFEIVLVSDVESDPAWERLRGLFSHPALRLGGATRAGMGNVRLVRWHEGCFDLGSRDGYAAWCRLGPGLGDLDGLRPRPPEAGARSRDWKTRRFRLRAEAGWRIGGTARAPLDARDGKPPDDVPHHEVRIEWNGDGPSIRERVAVVPASGVKGALAHRVAFHANRFAGRWGAAAPVGEECPEVAELFGAPAGSPRARAGRVFIEDVFFDPPRLHWQMHTSLDRFTGGVRQGLLFGEEVIWGGELELVLHYREDELSGNARRALDAALADLAGGRLPLGGGAARGHGVFTGEEVSDERA